MIDPGVNDGTPKKPAKKKKKVKRDSSYFMKRAFLLAQEAEKNNEVPVGAVIVKNKKVIGSGYNSPIKTHDATGHAEIIAIREAGQKTENYRLPETEMYVTLEPCLMCFQAIVNARITKLYFAASDPKTGVFSSDAYNSIKHLFNHSIEIEAGIMAEESSTLLKNFFQKKRRGAGEVERDGLENR